MTADELQQKIESSLKLRHSRLADLKPTVSVRPYPNGSMSVDLSVTFHSFAVVDQHDEEKFPHPDFLPDELCRRLEGDLVGSLAHLAENELNALLFHVATEAAVRGGYVAQDDVQKFHAVRRFNETFKRGITS